MTVLIRAAVSTDLPTILRLARDLAKFENATDAVQVTEAMLHEALFGPLPAAEALLAERDGHTIGYAIFYPSFSSWTGRRGMWLDDLFVSPEARGSGVGVALMKAMAQIAIDRGYARFEWWVLNWNAAAIEFYRSQGAVPQVERTVQRIEGQALLDLAKRN